MELAIKLSELFKVVSDPTRVRILLYIKDEERTVSEISEEVGLHQTTVSHQLSLMKAARVVKSRREGKYIFYSLDDNHIVELFNIGKEHILHD